MEPTCTHSLFFIALHFMRDITAVAHVPFWLAGSVSVVVLQSVLRLLCWISVCSLFVPFDAG